MGASNKAALMEQFVMESKRPAASRLFVTLAITVDGTVPALADESATSQLHRRSASSINIEPPHAGPPHPRIPYQGQ
jgi:hypothetical protein